MISQTPIRGTHGDILHGPVGPNRVGRPGRSGCRRPRRATTRSLCIGTARAGLPWRRRIRGPSARTGNLVTLWSGNSLSAVDAVFIAERRVGRGLGVAAGQTRSSSTGTAARGRSSRARAVRTGSTRPRRYTTSTRSRRRTSGPSVTAAGTGLDSLVEHYNGSTWSVVQAAPGASGYLTSVSATGPNDVWAVGATDGGDNIVEHYDGSGWSVVPSPQPGNSSSLDSVDALSPTDAWAVGTKSGFGAQESTFTLHWDGSAWIEVASPNPRNTGDARNELRSVVVLSKSNAWAVGTYENDQTSFHQDRTLTLHWNGAPSGASSPAPRPGRRVSSTAVASASSLGPSTTSRQVFSAGSSRTTRRTSTTSTTRCRRRSSSTELLFPSQPTRRLLPGALSVSWVDRNARRSRAFQR